MPGSIELNPTSPKQESDTPMSWREDSPVNLLKEALGFFFFLSFLFLKVLLGVGGLGAERSHEA